MKTSKALLKRYREHWKAVEEVTAAERAALTPDERLRQIAILHRFARWAGGTHERDVQEVRNRWIRLKEQHEKHKASLQSL